MTSIRFQNARVFDGMSPTLSAPQTVIVERGRIAHVGGTEEGTFDQTIDLAGRCLMPGLIDAHFHAYASQVDIPGLEQLPQTYLAHHGRHNLEAALRRGFTTIRDAGGADYGLWRAIEEGLIEGPRLFYAGRAFSQTGGHGDSRPQHLEPCSCSHQGTLSEVVDGVDEVRKRVREALRRGAHQIKIFVSGGVASPTDPIWMVQFSDEEIRAAVEEAASRRTYVMAHAYHGDAILRAVKCGVRSIEHGNLMTPEAAKVMAAHGAFLVPTLITYQAMRDHGDEFGLPVWAKDKLETVIHQGGDAIRMCAEAGVAIGFGTDLLGPLHKYQRDEFRLRGDFQSPVDVLRSATSVNAKLLNHEDKLGCIKPGAFADLIAVDGDPTADLAPLFADGPGPQLVMKGGKVMLSTLAQ